MTDPLEAELSPLRAAVERRAAIRRAKRILEKASPNFVDEATTDAVVVARALLAREQAAGWQPIETAPKDGTDVLLYSPDAISDAMIGHWVDGFGPPGDGGAWWPDNDSARFPIDAWPTHWQPLPPPPALPAKEPT